MRKYGVLLLLALATGIALLRVRTSADTRSSWPDRTAAERETTLTFAVTDAGIEPAESAVAKGSQVRLVVIGRKAAHVTLGGYEDRVSFAVANEETVRAEFLADRPGEDFGWQVDGRLAGRFAVTGSHLIEGHR